MASGANVEKSESEQSIRMISRPLEMLLRVFGIWPGILYGVICKVFWLILMITNTTLQYLFLIFHARSANLIIFMYSIAATLALSMKLIKLVLFWYNQRRFDEMWRVMSTNWGRNNVYTNAIGTAYKTHTSHFLPNFLVAFSAISIVMNSFSTLKYGIHYDETSNATQPFLLMMHLPFDSHKHSVYLIVLFLQFFYMMFLSTGAATLNSVLIILMFYLGDEIDVICRCLMDMGENEHKTNVILLKEIIRKHQSVITFSENVESLYTYIALMLVVLNTLITCGLGFILVKSIGAPNFSTILMKNLMFYCAINIETFVFCFAGEYISAKSKEIGEAAYSSPWYQSKFHGRTVLFLIMRSQNQLTITMGKFMNLSLEQFSNIIKASASYVSVLLAMI